MDVKEYYQVNLYFALIKPLDVKQIIYIEGTFEVIIKCLVVE